MEFQVMSREKAKRFSFHSHDFKSIIISITDTDLGFNQFNKIKSNGIIGIHQTKFDDTEIGENNCITDVQAKNIVDFVKANLKNVDMIIVHCEAGVSRSTGVCAALMKAINGDDWDIFNNPKYCPNMTCYRKIINQFMEINEKELISKENHNIEIWKKFNKID